MDKQPGYAEEQSVKAMHYLTVQDMLWVNLQVTRKVQHFNYAKLEEATYYQYGYGSSRDLARQAGRFLSGFLKLHPFDAGNEATAFVGCVAFLILNEHELRLSDKEGAEWLESIRSGTLRAEEVFGELVAERHLEHEAGIDVRNSVIEAIKAYPKTLGAFENEAYAAQPLAG